MFDLSLVLFQILVWLSQVNLTRRKNNFVPGNSYPIVQVFIYINLYFRPAVQKDLQHPLLPLCLLINFVLVVVIVSTFLFLVFCLVITGLGDLVYEEDCGPGLLQNKTLLGRCNKGYLYSILQPARFGKSSPGGSAEGVQAEWWQMRRWRRTGSAPRFPAKQKIYQHLKFKC